MSLLHTFKLYLIVGGTDGEVNCATTVLLKLTFQLRAADWTDVSLCVLQTNSKCDTKSISVFTKNPHNLFIKFYAMIHVQI